MRSRWETVVMLCACGSHSACQGRSDDTPDHLHDHPSSSLLETHRKHQSAFLLFHSKSSSNIYRADRLRMEIGDHVFIYFLEVDGRP